MIKIKNVSDLVELLDKDDSLFGKIYDNNSFEYRLLFDYHSTIIESLFFGFLGIIDDSIGFSKVMIDFLRDYHANEHDYDLSFHGFFMDSEDKLFDTFNLDRKTDGLIIPVFKTEYAVYVIIVPNERNFKELLHLQYSKEIFEKCPILIQLLRLVIDSYKATDKMYLTGLYKNHSTMYLLNNSQEMISKILSEKGLPDIHFVNSINALKYENRECYGGILLVNEFKNNKDDIVFEKKESLNAISKRTIRKMMEMTSEKLFLIVSKSRKSNDFCFVYDTWIVTGLSRKEDIPGSSIMAMIEFKGLSKWKMEIENEEVECFNGDYHVRSLYAPIKDSVKKAKDIINDHINTDSATKSRIVSIITEAQKQKHGALIIITKEAEKEAKRLCTANRGILIKPILIECRMVNNVCSIDGAIVIGTDGICYAIGVILDGVVDSINKGDISRGARYNSANIYVHNRNELTMAIVISEDGMIDVISNEKII